MRNFLLTAGLAIVVIFGFYLGKYLYLKPRNITGDKVPALTGALPDGTPFSLDDLRGQYVLIDFWGSWCGPCRASHPQLVRLYRHYQDQLFADAQGFEIVSVGIEKSPENWKSAIRSDSLSWPYHLMETSSFDSPQAKAFNVKQIPTKFLVNPEGTIIAVDPSFDEIYKMLDARIKQPG